MGLLGAGDGARLPLLPLEDWVRGAPWGAGDGGLPVSFCSAVTEKEFPRWPHPWFWLPCHWLPPRDRLAERSCVLSSAEMKSQISSRDFFTSTLVILGVIPLLRVCPLFAKMPSNASALGSRMVWTPLLQVIRVFLSSKKGTLLKIRPIPSGAKDPSPVSRSVGVRALALSSWLRTLQRRVSGILLMSIVHASSSDGFSSLWNRRRNCDSKLNHACQSSRPWCTGRRPWSSARMLPWTSPPNLFVSQLHSSACFRGRPDSCRRRNSAFEPSSKAW